MNRNIRLTILVCASLVVMMVCGLAYAVSPEEQAKICAEESLSHYVNIIKPVYKEFGLSSEDQLVKADLGEPLANVIIDPNEFTSNKAVTEQIQSHAFYVFPVIVEGETVMDFTVVLDKGEWRPVDIGGRLTRIVGEVSTSNNLSLKDIRVLRFAGQTFVLAEKDRKLVAYAPYSDYPENGLKAKQLISEQELTSILETIQKTYLENSRSKDGEILYGATGSGAAPFDQKSVSQRVINYLTYVF